MKKHEKEGSRLIKKYPQVANYARQKAIEEMCEGEYNTDFYRALANVAIDFKEGLITKEKYEELTNHLTMNAGNPEGE
jgi:hypothetical protein